MKKTLHSLALSVTLALFAFTGLLFFSPQAQASTLQLDGTITDLGVSIVTGDMDDDGDDDLIVGDYEGLVHIFYNDGSYPSSASSADVTITGEEDSFGRALAAGDFDDDGDMDLAVGAESYNSGGFYQGRSYIFYQDGSWPASAASADVIITGQPSASDFGYAIVAGDMDNDNDTDLIIGSLAWDTDGFANNGRVYIFYQDGSWPSDAENADVIITGETTSYFGYSVATGDLDDDGDDDLAVGGISTVAAQVAPISSTRTAHGPQMPEVLM